MRDFSVIDLGLVDYGAAYKTQKAIVENRKAGSIDDCLILARHYPVITYSRLSKKRNILADLDFLKDNNIQLFETDRGGDVTYHDQGQLIAYPVIDLISLTRDLHKYLSLLEDTVIEFLKSFSLNGIRKRGYTGVWINKKKIASIGIGVSKWISYHGLSININTDSRRFSLINPCGLDYRVIGSLKEILGRQINSNMAKSEFIKAFVKIIGISNERIRAAY